MKLIWTGIGVLAADAVWYEYHGGFIVGMLGAFILGAALVSLGLAQIGLVE